MWKKISGSLTLRIFLITTALLAATCALTYGALAYLTPITYTAMLEGELEAATEALLARLEATTYEKNDTELQRFTRETGAMAEVFPLDSLEVSATEGSDKAEVTDAHDKNLAEEALVQEVSIVTVYDEDTEAETAYAGDAIAQVEERNYKFRFSDGREAVLVVSGGLRAVNRTAEAMQRVLPYLSLALLAFSLVGALLYARFITRPVVEISGIAARLARQDFRARWTHRRRDEIGKLGRSLNQLADSLSGALSDLQAVNAKLRADIERERELERQQMAFFSATSHELKTPVTILKGQLSGMLAQVGAYRDREKYLSRALEVAGRMEGLIQQILTVSRLESTPEIADEPVDLSALLHRQLEQDAELIEARGLRLTMDISPGVTLCGSARLLSSAIDNILMNAILYTPFGAEIRVTLNPRALYVFNSGAHIDKSALPHLFEPFYRVDSSRNRANGGSGLGLYLVRRIFVLHGIACEIRNVKGGVAFLARLNA